MKGIGYTVAVIGGLVGSLVIAFMLMWSLGIPKVLGIFFIVHLVAYLLAAWLDKAENIGGASLALMSPPLVVFFGWWLISEAGSLYVSLATKNKFVEDCKTVREQYFQLPASPVHSIAYDWNGPHEPYAALYKVESNDRIVSIGGFDKPIPEFDKAIEFTERKRGRSAGVSAPYVRFRDRDFQGIRDLSADVLVTYRFIHPEELSKAPIYQESVGYDLTVTDRRDGRKIAAMRYFVDHRSQRICGPIKDNVLSEKIFLAKALGFK